MRGYIRKRAENSYQLTVSGGRDAQTGKRLRKYIQVQGSYKDAQRALAEALHQVNSGIPLALPGKGRVTVREHFTAWLEGYARMSTRPTTFESYRITVEKHIIPVLGSIRLDKLDPRHLQKLYADKLVAGRADGRSGGLSARSVRYIHSLLREGLEQAREWGLVGRNVADLVNPPKQAKKEMQTLTREQVQAFLAANRTDRLYALWRLALGTGLRRGELLGLRWADINLMESYLTVRQQIVCIKGLPTVQEPKTKKSTRVVPLSEDIVEALRQHRLGQTEERLVATKYSGRDLVFAGSSGEVLDPRAVSRLFERRLKKAGLPPIRFHDIRHTFATIALEAGVPLKVVSEMLGHEKISTTGDVYQHVLRHVEEKYADLVAELMRPN
ncbi:MAG: site-specific integrase [Bacillota bacterium]